VFMCRLLGVSVSGFYAWRARPTSARAEADTGLARLIATMFTDHQGRYGVRRIHAELARAGRHVGYKRVQRLMAEEGLRSVHPRPLQANHDPRCAEARPGRPRRPQRQPVRAEPHLGR